jgi:NTP pyrophosphatase (non-canonical NTP hydrolase)
MSMTIKQLVEESHGTALAKGWHENQRTPGELIALMHSELSEALEEVRDGHNLHEVYLSDKGKPEGFGVELADCVVRIADACGLYGIDLDAILAQKMAYNKTRPHRHGGKVL